jgi:hypothetical protein
VIIVLACAFVVAVEALVLRRRLARLFDLRFRHFYLVWLALLDQVLVISVLPGHDHLVLDIANLLSYGAAGLFVWSNRHLPGILLVGAGGALNLLVIAANGGTMPASAGALAASGWRPQPGHFTNSAVVTDPKLSFLGDIFATPRWIPAHDVFSIGDVLIVIAVAILVYRTCAAGPRMASVATDTGDKGDMDRPDRQDDAATDGMPWRSGSAGGGLRDSVDRYLHRSRTTRRSAPSRSRDQAVGAPRRV